MRLDVTITSVLSMVQSELHGNVSENNAPSFSQTSPRLALAAVRDLARDIALEGYRDAGKVLAEGDDLEHIQRLKAPTENQGFVVRKSARVVVLLKELPKQLANGVPCVVHVFSFSKPEQSPCEDEMFAQAIGPVGIVENV